MRALTSSGVSHQDRGGQRLGGKYASFSQRHGATFSALVRVGAPRLCGGPGTSWATSVGPLNWASAPVITQHKNHVSEILIGQIRRQPPIQAALFTDACYNPSFGFFYIQDSCIFFPFFFAVKM